MRSSAVLGFLREDVAAISPALVSDPGYEGKLGFLHLVDADMKRILDLANATPEHPLVVFVDDLDRCSYGDRRAGNRGPERVPRG